MEKFFYIALAVFYLIVMPILVVSSFIRSERCKKKLDRQIKELESLKNNQAAQTKLLNTLYATFQDSAPQASREQTSGVQPEQSAHAESEKRRRAVSEKRQRAAYEAGEKEFSVSIIRPPDATTPSSTTAIASTTTAIPSSSSPSSTPTPTAIPLSAKQEPATQKHVLSPEPLSVPEVSPEAVTPPQRPYVVAQKSETVKTPPVSKRSPWVDHFLAWCIGGNPLVRVGVLILFLGVSFLLKLAVDYGWFPIELRLSGVALGAAALLVIGWRLRDKRRNYGLLLQGGGVGILYLVIYAAFAYYKLFPKEAAVLAFFLLFAVCAFSAFLAVRQNASALAVMGMAGGFAAPVLISTGSGNHIALFSYFTLLNAGVLGIAWFRAWRSLNLLGFMFTLGVGSLWAVKYCTFARLESVSYLLSVEFFLVLFFLYYVAVAVLYAIRRELELKRYVDGTLMFGVPIAFSFLQARLVGHIEFAMAGSAVALGAFYLLLAAWVMRYRMERLRLVFESMLALGVLFLTLAVPLAFAGTRLTVAIWAVEGAALCWIAMRQQHRLALASGLVLQVLAALLFYAGSSRGMDSEPQFLLNSWYIGALMLSLSALFTGWQLRGDATRSCWTAFEEVLSFMSGGFQQKRSDAPRPWLGGYAQLLSLLFGGMGLFWWLASGGIETNRFFGSFVMAPYAHLLFAVLTAWLAYAIGRRLRWPELEWVALALPPVLFLSAVHLFFVDTLPFAHWGWCAWPLALLMAYVLLFFQERRAVALPSFFSTIPGLLHSIMFWTLCLVAALEFQGFVAWQVPEGVWQWSSWAFVGAALLSAIIFVAPHLRWPVERFRSYYLTLGAAPVALLTSGWAFLGFGSDGNPDPLPYVPFLNPVELCQLFVFAAVFYWARANKAVFSKWIRVGQSDSDAPATQSTIVVGNLPEKMMFCLLTPLLFLLLNTALLRTLHQYAGFDYRIETVLANIGPQLWFVALWVAFVAAGLLLLRKASVSQQRLFLLMTVPLLALLWLWSVCSSLSSQSGAWGFVPLFNVFDLAQVSVIVLALFVLTRLRPMDIEPKPCLPVFATMLGVSGFVWLNTMLLRTLHHWIDIPYRFNSLFASMTVQTALSLLWSFLALVVMVWAVRRAQRIPWFVGITLLALTVCKLFFIEFSHIDGVARIFSFVGVGVLLLLIGYVAPLPPKKKETV